MHTQRWDQVYLSPHPDDVALSCGGTIRTQTARGEAVLVITVFAATPLDDELTPFARELKARWGAAPDPTAVRRAEDLAAVSILGAAHLHLPYPDCVYRTDPASGAALYPDVEAIFAQVAPAEKSWHLDLADEVRHALSASPQATLYAPLTAGHHVDHILVQRAAFELLRVGCPVLLYEDYPYAGDPEALERALATLPVTCRAAERVAFGEAAMEAKLAAVACHASQISTFWRDASGDADLPAMRRALRAYAASPEAGGYAERYWRPDPDCLADSALSDTAHTQR